VHPAAEPVYHLAVVQVPDRAAATKALDDAEVGWGVHYPVPCHVQPAFAAYATGSLPVAEAAAARILSLPLHPALTAAQVGDVCTVLGHVDA
jgi:dTDP-4-amino-4,6-dideoxygalactose transaminase